MNVIFNSYLWLIVLQIINASLVPSYNLPKFCSSALWDPDAITIANSITFGNYPFGLFIDINNTVYVANIQSGYVQAWFDGSLSNPKTIATGLVSPFSIFVALDGDLFVYNNAPSYRVEKWTGNLTKSIDVMYVVSACRDLFIDMAGFLYCSIDAQHQVVIKSLNDTSNATSIIAGTGSPGSTPTTLQYPQGIFVDSNFDLYVADSSNDRIQLFRSGQMNALTVPINGSYGTFTLTSPSDVVLDGDGYLFIVDSYNNRILGSDITGFRCIVGCMNASVAAFNQLLNHPYTVSFDSDGNLFVIDYNNNRLQKFIFMSNSCDATTTAKLNAVTTSSIAKNETSMTTISYQFGGQSLSIFRPSICQSSTYIGSSCNTSALPCSISNLCQNNATCLNNNNTFSGYTCTCLSGFNGTQCQYNYQPCQSHTCWNNGVCYVLSNTTFNCSCQSGWTGIHCERKINFCENITCLNQGVCQSLLNNYTCQCLAGSYFGHYCEITTKKIMILKIVSKSFAWIAIIAMIAVIIFVIIMDVLKYCFHIDPVNSIRKEYRSRKRAKKITTYILGKISLYECESTELPNRRLPKMVATSV
ncbi:hypothetical protein I4U23_023547 [Adineta vaga]|nr:hypothetical protein I4U23_023547 [Adineta vaga]